MTERIKVGEAPSDVATGYGGVWLVNNEALQEIDPRRNVTLISQPPSVGDGGLGLALGAGSVWSTAALNGVVVRFDPKTYKRTTVRTPRAGPSDVAVGEGAVWAVSSAVGLVSRIDPRRDRVTGSTPAGNDPSGIAAGAGSVWVANLGDDSVTRIDPDSGKSAGAPIPVGDAPAGIAVGGGAVWVANSGDGSVTRIDPRTGRVTATIKGVGLGPSDVATGLGYVWVVNSKSDTLARDRSRQEHAGRQRDPRGHRLDRRRRRIRRSVGGRLAGQRDRTSEALTEEREFPSWERRGTDVGLASARGALAPGPRSA